MNRGLYGLQSNEVLGEPMRLWNRIIAVLKASVSPDSAAAVPGETGDLLLRLKHLVDELSWHSRRQ